MLLRAARKSGICSGENVSFVTTHCVNLRTVEEMERWKSYVKKASSKRLKVLDKSEYFCFWTKATNWRVTYHINEVNKVSEPRRAKKCLSECKNSNGWDQPAYSLNVIRVVSVCTKSILFLRSANTPFSVWRFQH